MIHAEIEGCVTPTVSVNAWTSTKETNVRTVSVLTDTVRTISVSAMLGTKVRHHTICPHRCSNHLGQCCFNVEFAEKALSLHSAAI